MLTNGKRTIDIFWLTHDGTDVYAGTPNIDEKFSYHQSGKVHRKSNGEKTSESWQLPLSEFKKQFQITTIAIGNLEGMLSKASESFDYTGKKGDTIITIDSRTMSEDQINISIGLLEPHNYRVLKRLASNSTSEFSDGVSIEYITFQVVLSTSVEPWIYVVLTKNKRL